jgi:hypothetical protein
MTEKEKQEGKMVQAMVYRKPQGFALAKNSCKSDMCNDD